MKFEVRRRIALLPIILSFIVGFEGCSSVLASSDGAALQAAIDARGNSGGVVQMPCGTVFIKQTIVIKHPIELRGCGTSIGAPTDQFFNGYHIQAAFPGTRLIWTGGAGVALDVGPQSRDFDARGTVLRDFNLENQGGGSVGVRINTQEPRIINVYIMSLGDETPGKPFSTAGILVGDIENSMVNDFLCRECYVRFQQDGIQLLGVSEATIDHSRILENFGNNIVLGDPKHISNNIQIVNGTNFSSARVNTGAGIKITRAANIVNVIDGYCEHDDGVLCIDASEIVGGDLNQLNIRDTYFATLTTPPSPFAVALNAPTANVVISGNVFLGQSIAGVHNQQSGTLNTEFNSLLRGTPALVSPNISH